MMLQRCHQGMQSDFQAPYFFGLWLATGERMPSGKQYGVGWLIETALPPGVSGIPLRQVSNHHCYQLIEEMFHSWNVALWAPSASATRTCRWEKLDQLDNGKKEKLQHTMLRCMVTSLEATSLFIPYPHYSILSTFVNLTVWLVGNHPSWLQSNFFPLFHVVCMQNVCDRQKKDNHKETNLCNCLVSPKATRILALWCTCWLNAARRSMETPAMQRQQPSHCGLSIIPQ